MISMHLLMWGKGKELVDLVDGGYVLYYIGYDVVIVAI